LRDCSCYEFLPVSEFVFLRFWFGADGFQKSKAFGPFFGKIVDRARGATKIRPGIAMPGRIFVS